MFSLNSMRSRFHNTSLGKVIAFIAFGAMIVLAISGIGANLSNKNQVAPTSAQATNNVIATVNGTPVSRSSYEKALERGKQYAAMSGQPVNPFSMLEVRMTALTQALNTVQLALVAKQAGITVSDGDIAAFRDQQLGQIKQQLKLPDNASDADVNNALAQYGNSIDNIFPADELHDQVLIQKYQAQIKAQNTPTQDQLIASFRKVHTRHILISNKSRPDAQAKALAAKLIVELTSGADFAKLVNEYSDDSASKPKGGDDGVISRDTNYVPEFLDAALQLKDAQITPEPILSPQYGYFIIQAISSTDNLPKDFAKKKAQYMQTFADKMQQSAEKTAFDTASSQGVVIVTDPMLAAYKDIYKTAETPAELSDAIVNLKKALPTAQFSDKPEIYAVMGQIYAQQKDTPNEIAALNSSVQAQDDPTVRMVLGDAYQKSGDKKNALLNFQDSSVHAYSDPMIHSNLQSIYQKMGETKLADTEKIWMTQYMKQQKQASAGPTMNANSPIQVKTSQ